MKTEVERYTERYLKQSQIDDNEWTPGTYVTHHHGVRWNTKKEDDDNIFIFLDWNLFPKELMPRRKRPRAKTGTLNTLCMK